ncbi:MAG: TonB-dependent receptor [Bacteroidetes bacterium]|nr:TonB-dependent receptor [Bacteroidota bacterium]MBU1720239.1 TonB-dependent receptor [Bacteroidota bacterium]
MSIARHILLFLVLLISVNGFSQQIARVKGRITNEDGVPQETVYVSIYGMPYGTASDSLGNYNLKVPANVTFTVVYKSLGFKPQPVKFEPMLPGTEISKNIVLVVASFSLPPIDITEEILKFEAVHYTKVDPKYAYNIPAPSGSGVTELVKRIGLGTSGNNELSSQYNVRGGNYDENLVYVNGVEIYRPFLVRSGQQEGLSFPNSDLIEDISFSAGGFEAKYGDKMSSVLDIRYKKPVEFKGSAAFSLLGGSMHLEGTTMHGRLAYLIGVRQKSNQYLLKSLETKGAYRPSFSDVQTFLTYTMTETWDLSFLGNFSRNVFRMVPETRQTDFGTIKEALRLTIYFDGQEADAFRTLSGALISDHNPNKNLNLKFILSAFHSVESETFDIMGQYRIDQLENDMGKDEFGDVAFNRGIGTFLNHARNSLDAYVANASHKGTYIKGKSTLSWGARFQYEDILDKLDEWQMIDSAGYTLPIQVDSPGYVNPGLQEYQLLEMQNVVKTTQSLISYRTDGYFQNTWDFVRDSSHSSLCAGIRANYWNQNNQITVSPRLIYSYKPRWKKPYIFRASAGFYHQPPFYRELRNMDGNLNFDLKAQESIHFVLGAEHQLRIWGRPFKYVTEIYYKYLDNLVPYEIDNVRIRYYAENSARGYATGIDMKLNGEFVKGIESWVSMSFMNTMEDIKDDFYYDYFNQDGERIIPGYTFDRVAVDSIRYEPGYIPRPTDQRLNFSLFFQDYLPKNPNFKMHLNLVYGTSLPFGPPSFERHKDTLRIPSYRRVDIGFSAQLLSEDKKLPEKNPLRFFKTIWLSLEVFNLLQVNNTISYLWVKDVTDRQYAIPNYLTPRQLNAKIVFNF